MDMDNAVGIDCGSRGWTRQRRAMGENWYNCNRINENNKKKLKKEKEHASAK